jgi:diguanylate cyclase (GGDEF)-like protein/putative nucleotidyltransferase with HDIG domain
MDAFSPQNSTWDVDVTLSKVPGVEFSVQISTQIIQVAELFKQHPEINGILLFDSDRLFGLVTRERLFEVLGKPYGNELFRKKTIREFFIRFGSPPMVVSQTERVDAVVNAALARKLVDRYSPIVVDFHQNGYRLVDMVSLLTIQNRLLTDLYQKVHESSILDPLTNVYNRRGFREGCKQLQGWNEGICQRMSVLMLDIDHFKKVNDVFGHLAGDKILQVVARECSGIIRDGDVIVRFGGEEFCIVLNQIDQSRAVAVADRIRMRIEEMETRFDNRAIKITISIGVASADIQPKDLDELIMKADKALYQAKDQGRNRVACHSEDASLVPVETRTPMSAEELQNSVYEETIWGWVKILELRDKETEDHACRVAQTTILIAQKLGLPQEQIVHIRRGALLHDIGKIAIPDDILFKPGRLTEAEWKVMHQHPVHAYELLKPIGFLQQSTDIPYCHHEHWDGSGYPRGLKGEEIPLAARIFSIVDVWDALRSDRRYRAAWQDEHIFSYLLEQKGKLFDPDLVDLFIETVFSDVQVFQPCEAVMM